MIKINLKKKPFYFLEYLKITEATQLPSTSSTTACIENNKFYRNPDRIETSIWTLNECAKYYLCLGNKFIN